MIISVLSHQKWIKSLNTRVLLLTVTNGGIAIYFHITEMFWYRNMVFKRRYILSRIRFNMYLRHSLYNSHRSYAFLHTGIIVAITGHCSDQRRLRYKVCADEILESVLFGWLTFAYIFFICLCMKYAFHLI